MLAVGLRDPAWRLSREGSRLRAFQLHTCLLVEHGHLLVRVDGLARLGTRVAGGVAGLLLLKLVGSCHLLPIQPISAVRLVALHEDLLSLSAIVELLPLADHGLLGALERHLRRFVVLERLRVVTLQHCGVALLLVRVRLRFMAWRMS